MAGAVIGEGGKRINHITRETSAHVKVFPAGSLPPCAAVSDELLQISGSSQAVKKALIMASGYLQRSKPQLAGTSSRVSNTSTSTSTNIAGINADPGRRVAKEVVFRLLCPCDAAGAVLGWKGRKVKALEIETGACIYFSAPEVGCNERVITVSAFENKESQYSAAQNAVLRVFNEFTSSDGKGSVTARLLIQPNQASWLNGGESSVLAAIQEASRAKYKYQKEIVSLVSLLMRESFSWRLRGSYFDTLVAPFLPHQLFKLSPSVDGAATLLDKMNKCRVSEVKVNGSVPDWLPQSQFSNGHYSSRTGAARELAAADCGFGLGSGNKSLIVTNTKVEIAIQEDVFGSVYGENGSNLARLRQISGATVDVQDPRGGSEGKVILSGTPDQVLAAQSLLQAFTMSAR